MKKLISIFFLLYITIHTQAQYVRPNDATSSTPSQPPSQLPSNSFLNHLSIGGSFGLQFGDVTYVALEPLLSYHFNESLMIGIGPIYQYENVDAQVNGYGYSSSIYGGRLDVMFFLPDEFSRVFIMGECDVLNLPEFNTFTYQLSRGTLTLPMLGIGYKEPITDKFFFCAYILWNFNNSLDNPYTNPLINVGIDVGLGR